MLVKMLCTSCAVDVAISEGSDRLFDTHYWHTPFMCMLVVLRYRPHFHHYLQYPVSCQEYISRV